jgi:transcription elongation factor Elf1
MSQPTVHVCPLCGSKSVIVSDPNAAQTAVGATCTLKCECGAVVTLDVEKKGNADAAKEKA